MTQVNNALVLVALLQKAILLLLLANHSVFRNMCNTTPMESCLTWNHPLGPATWHIYVKLGGMAVKAIAVIGNVSHTYQWMVSGAHYVNVVIAAWMVYWSFFLHEHACQSMLWYYYVVFASVIVLHAYMEFTGHYWWRTSIYWYPRILAILYGPDFQWLRNERGYSIMPFEDLFSIRVGTIKGTYTEATYHPTTKEYSFNNMMFTRYPYLLAYVLGVWIHRHITYCLVVVALASVIVVDRIRSAL